MREPIWLRAIQVGVAAALLAFIAALSNLPYGAPPQQGLLRLAWRASGAQVRLCRRRSAEELSRLTEHMRQAEECRQRTLPYRLAVRLDGAERVAHAVTSVGAQGDRPLYVQQELPLTPGGHTLEIDFAPAPRLAEGPDGIKVDNDAQRLELQRAFAAAPDYRLSTSVQGEPGHIVLVVLDEEGRSFRILGPSD